MSFIDFSTIHQKYVVTIRINSVNYFTVWGTDLSDGDKDKVIISEQNKIILLRNNNFKKFFDVKKNLRYAFDVDNFLRWVNSDVPGETLFKSYAKYDVDMFSSIVFTEKTDENTAREVFKSILFFSDYAYQVDNKEFIKLYKSKVVSTFRDFMYSLDLWHTEKSIGKLFIDKSYNGRLNKALMKLYDIMIASVDIR